MFKQKSQAMVDIKLLLSAVTSTIVVNQADHQQSTVKYHQPPQLIINSY